MSLRVLLILADYTVCNLNSTVKQLVKYSFRVFFSTKMGKRKQTQEEFYFKIVKEFPNQLQTDKKKLFCKICQIQINAAKKSQVTQHLQTANHKKRLADNPSSSQQLLTNMVVSNENDEPQYANKSFNVELCDAFVSGS